MKKILLLLSILSCAATVNAQKYLEVYKGRDVIGSMMSTDIDSVRITGNNANDRQINFYTAGVKKSFVVSSVDSIIVVRSTDDPLVYLGILGFNQELYTMPIDILANSTSSRYSSFVSNLIRKDGTLLYYGVDNALNYLTQYNFKTPLSSVNLITFTDGLDQGSLMMNSSYMTDAAYLSALNRRIASSRVKGLPITAYSLGLRGNDVSDYTQFQTNLRQLASSVDKAIEVTSMSDVQKRLQEIADQIISISNRQTISVKIPGVSNGTRIRFTFDGNSPEYSTLYIEGTFNLADRSLRNVTYHGMRATSSSTIQGTQEGIFVTFTFTGLQRTDGNGLIPTSYIRQYNRAATSESWQRNSEFTPDNNTQTTITHSGAAIMLVLDCSSSLGSQFSNMQSYARDFINRVANNAAPFNVDAPTNVVGEMDINGSDIVINVSWDAVKNAEYYRLYRSSISYGDFTLMADSLTSTTWTDKAPGTGNNYYRVYAMGHGLTSNSTTSEGVAGNIAAPKNVTASLDDNDMVIHVSWDAVKYAESYTIYRNGSEIATGITSTSWTDETPRSGNNYYSVRAVGHGMTSSSSENTTSINCFIAAPQNVSASLDDNDFVIHVSWEAVKYAESYTIYRNGSEIATGITSTSWTDETPRSGNNYYSVRAVGHGMTSSTSENTASINCSIAAPQNVTASLGKDGNSIIVTWDAVKYAESYTVYRSTNASSGFTVIADGITSNSWSETPPNYGFFYYKVYAVGHGLTSAASEVSNIVSYNHYEYQTLSNGIRFNINGVKFTMIKVEGGTFQMGQESVATPVHQVTLTNDYYIGETEVTQELWTAVMGSNPSYFKSSDQLPVETVSWNDCQTFITKLNALTGRTFRLPTEAEWEFAARGGNASKGYTYSGSNTVGEVAWYWDNIPSKSSGTTGYGTQPVATKAPNELGIYDMSGNVWEWCQDWYGSYRSSAQTNPTGPTSGSDRVIRGGSWGYDDNGCRVAGRYFTPVTRDSSHGFRLAL